MTIFDNAEQYESTNNNTPQRSPLVIVQPGQYEAIIEDIVNKDNKYVLFVFRISAPGTQYDGCVLKKACGNHPYGLQMIKEDCAAMGIKNVSALDDYNNRMQVIGSRVLIEVRHRIKNGELYVNPHIVKLLAFNQAQAATAHQDTSQDQDVRHEDADEFDELMDAPDSTAGTDDDIFDF